MRTIKKSRNGLRQINWCYFVCLSRSDVLYYCFLCPIHVQIYSANLLALCSFCLVHRSSFPMFGLKLFRKWVFSTCQEPFHKQRQGLGLRAAQWLQRSWQPHSPSKDLAHPLELQRGIGAEKKKVQLQKLLYTYIVLGILLDCHHIHCLVVDFSPCGWEWENEAFIQSHHLVKSSCIFCFIMSGLPWSNDQIVI